MLKLVVMLVESWLASSGHLLPQPQLLGAGYSGHLSTPHKLQALQLLVTLGQPDAISIGHLRQIVRQPRVYQCSKRTFHSLKPHVTLKVLPHVVVKLLQKDRLKRKADLMLHRFLNTRQSPSCPLHPMAQQSCDVLLD